MARPIRVLYIAYWGAAEPLGQSLILPAVLRLAASGVEMTLVTFEKPADFARRDEIEQLRRRLAAEGIHWIPLRYHKRPKVPATAFDIAHGVARGLLVRLRSRPDIIHARTYIGGIVGQLLAPVLRARLIYHNEGFYPDEQVDGGVWAAGSTPYLAAKRIELAMYGRADGLIVLSRRARRDVETLPAVVKRGTPIVVVPSCVDLEAFRVENPPLAPNGRVSLSYIGSIGGRYIFDHVARFVAAAARELRGVDLQVLTRTEPEWVDAMLRKAGVPDGSWSVDYVQHCEVPQALRGRQAGLFFLTQGTSEHGCSPTKIGEYWALGMPVVTTPNVSDTDEIVVRERVGVIVRDHNEEEYRRAAAELLDLLRDPELANRCRHAAETHYALAPSCDRQVELYMRLTGIELTRPAAAAGLR